jgi:DNA invertase Pin-like site-specific DNA recombinase
MKYGYARVSTDDQNSALHLAALKRAGCLGCSSGAYITMIAERQI